MTKWSDSKEPLWEQVPEPVEPRREPVAAPVERTAARRRRWPVVAAVLVAALTAWAGWATYAMRENGRRADAWREQSQSIRAHAQELDATLVARTRALNDRIDQLNVLGARLADQQAALKQSQGDVSTLEVRQRQLAAEKAQLEDRAQALTVIARSYSTCKQDLVDLLTAVSDGTDATATYDAARSSCSLADDQLQAYTHSF